ncbi:DNA (cytosine-5-)-methyltransferase [Sediminicola luteus]|uniref:Cytosine-specific methyltransferase n=1 Tax=Sediminicola luteus TaxID=319238 RepID=A0ABV2TWY6_9FLAO
MSNKLKFIDLFAGIGGFHYALKELGHKCVLASEIQPDLRKMYAINHHDLPSENIIGDIHNDIRTEDIPSFDILCAGFPCQPFSQAGYRMGLNDPVNGNHFLKLVEIINFHKPSYIFLENVPNLRGHDDGNTWKIIKTSLEKEGYKVDERIYSPDQFGVPQHRKRIYIVAIKTNGKKLDIIYPSPEENININFNDYLEKGPNEDIPLKEETLKHILHWDKFVTNIAEKEGKDIPRFPVWSMEFGATYPFMPKATSKYALSDLNKTKGKFGLSINAKSRKDLENYLPKYSLTDQDVFPRWKTSYIESNRKFFLRHADWIEDWKKDIVNWKLSHQKFEWNCGTNVDYSLEDKIIQFRPSGIRVKNRDRFPALVLSTTQVPIIFDKYKKGGAGFRYITKREAANLQSMPKENFEIMDNHVSAYRSFGNAVNVKVIKEIVRSVIGTAIKTMNKSDKEKIC